MNDLQVTSGFSLQPTSFDEAMQFSKLIANSSLVPPAFKGKAADVLVAVQMGAELGLQPMQAIQNICVINGRPCVWGDAMLAIVKAHKQFEYLQEHIENDVAYCKVKRKGEPEHIQKFSIEDAKKANLWGKSGPWTQYPKRMLQMRARGFAIRDSFPDALRGINLVEEVTDYSVSKARDMGDLKVVDDRAPVESVISDIEENSSQEYEVALEDEITELNELIFDTEVSEEVVNKWLIKSGVETVEEMPRDFVLKCINHLKP